MGFYQGWFHWHTWTQNLALSSTLTFLGSWSLLECKCIEILETLGCGERVALSYFLPSPHFNSTFNSYLCSARGSLLGAELSEIQDPAVAGSSQLKFVSSFLLTCLSVRRSVCAFMCAFNSHL